MPMRLRDLHRRIRTIMVMVPASTWDAEEAQIVFEALARIVARRQAAGDVVDPVPLRPLGEPTAQLRDQLVV